MSKFRSAYKSDYVDPGIDCSGDEILTEQSHRDACDVNNIVKSFQRTGLLPSMTGEAKWGDFTGVDDYQSALNSVIAADDAFSTLSAEVRDRFANDPANLLAFLENPKNKAEAIKLGLIEAPVEVSPGATLAPVVPPKQA